MTDNDIVKALECCILSECENCPHDEETACKENLNQEILDLINRQKAEIESANKRADMWHREAELNAGELIKMQAEIEKFKEIETTVNEFWSELQKLSIAKGKEKPTLEELLEYIEQVKAEAIKECIEKTQEFLSTKCRGVVEDNPNLDEILYGYRVEDVDEFFNNLVKEMVGDAE